MDDPGFRHIPEFGPQFGFGTQESNSSSDHDPSLHVVSERQSQFSSILII